MDNTVNEEWIKDLNKFIDHWEQELDLIKNKQLIEDECNSISEVFKKDKNLLLCRKPVGISEDLISHLESVSRKLDASLAQALCSMKM